MSPEQKQFRKELRNEMNGTLKCIAKREGYIYNSGEIALLNEASDSDIREGQIMAQHAQELEQAALDFFKSRRLDVVVCNEFLSQSYPKYTFNNTYLLKSDYDECLQEIPNRDAFPSYLSYITIGAAFGGPYAQMFFRMGEKC